MTVLLEILCVYIWPLWPFVFCLSFILSVNQRFWPDSGHILRHQYGISVAESQTFLRAREVTAFSQTWFSYVLLQLLPTLSIVLLDNQLLILRQLRCHVHVSEFLYPVEFNGAKKPTLEGSAWSGRLNLSSLSLFSFSELNKAIFHNSTRTTNSIRLILASLAKRQQFHTWSFARITSNEPFALRAETSPRSSMIPLETKFNTQTTVISHRRRKRFSSSAGHLFRSEFSDYRQNTGFGDKSIVSLHFPRKFRAGQLGLLSINFDLRNVIFQPMVFPFVWGKYKWKFMSDRYKFSFPRPLAASPLARPFSRSSLRSPK